MGVAGARLAVRPARPGAGRAARSSLPFLVSGMASSVTNADGTMYSGRRSVTHSRSAGSSASPTT
ncbi:hypothetical protein SFUMM280S_07639 [Streptomyces fumanus]